MHHGRRRKSRIMEKIVASLIKASGGSAGRQPSALDLYLARIDANLELLRVQTTLFATAVAEAKAAMRPIPED